MKITSAGTIASAGMAALLAAGCGTAAASAASGGHGADTAARVHACTARQLGLGFEGGSQPATGNDFGAILIWNKSATACALAGPVKVVGLNKAGRKVTRTEKLPVFGPALTAHGISPVRYKLTRRETVASVFLSAEYRDDPTSSNGMSTTHQVEPAAWRIILPSGAVRTVANADQYAGRGNAVLPRDGGLLTCRGELNTNEPITIRTQG